MNAIKLNSLLRIYDDNNFNPKRYDKNMKKIN